jgi:acyl carrier protein
MAQPTVAELVSLIAQELELPESKIDAQSSAETIPEWDSMAQLNICLAIQDRFGITLDLEEIATATSVPALLRLLG